MAAEKRREWREMSPERRAEVLAECEQNRRDAQAALDHAKTLERIETLHAESGVTALHSDRSGEAMPWVPPPDDAEERIWEALRSNRIVLLIGEPGRGKTRLLCRMVERWIDSTVRSAQFSTLSGFMRKRQAEFGKTPLVVDRLKRCGLLAFDEIDKAAWTDNGMRMVRNELFEVFNERYHGLRPLILAGNNASMFEDHGDPMRLGELMTERLRERGLVIDVSAWPWMRGVAASADKAKQPQEGAQ